MQTTDQQFVIIDPKLTLITLMSMSTKMPNIAPNYSPTDPQLIHSSNTNISIHYSLF